MARNYNKPRLVSVQIEGFGSLKYGFPTRVKDATSTDLGHTKIDGTGVQNLVIGANNPKPPRASKRTEQGIESSFIDKGKIKEAKGNGYRISRGRFRPARNTKFTEVKYVLINKVKYAWNAPKTDNEPSELTSTGVEEPGENDTDLVFGAQFPKPPRGSIEVTDGRYSTFINPDKLDDAVGAGWVPTSNGDYKVAQLKQRLLN